MEAEPFPVVEDAAKFRGEVAQRIVREFHRVRGEHRRGHRADLYAHAGEDRDRHRQRRAPETRHIVDRGDSGDWIAHSETPGKGLDGGKTSEEGFSFPRPLSLPKTFDLFKGGKPHCFSGGRSLPYRELQIKILKTGQKQSSSKEQVCYDVFQARSANFPLPPPIFSYISTAFFRAATSAGVSSRASPGFMTPRRKGPCATRTSRRMVRCRSRHMRRIWRFRP